MKFFLIITRADLQMVQSNAILNDIEYVQLSQCQILEPKIRKSLIFMAILTFFFFMEHYIVIKHNIRMEDALPSAEDPNFSPKARSIFFHETFSSGLSVRQACAVEAAARAHPKREIYVLFSKPVTENELNTGCLANLLQFPNIKFRRVHEAEYSKGTVLQSILVNDVVQSTFRIQHAADILRILTLNKWGGIYLDTDMIVTKSLEHLPLNFVGKETELEISSGIISFAKDEIGTNVTSEIIKEIGKDYSPLFWSDIGTKAIDRVLSRLCPEVMRSEGYTTKPFTNCTGVTIFDYDLFYPQHFLDIDDIFNPPPKKFDLNHPYTYHMYDFLSHYRKIGRGTIYDLVAKAFCPAIHSAYNHEFSAEVVTASKKPNKLV